MNAAASLSSEKHARAVGLLRKRVCSPDEPMPRDYPHAAKIGLLAPSLLFEAGKILGIQPDNIVAAAIATVMAIPMLNNRKRPQHFSNVTWTSARWHSQRRQAADDAPTKATADERRRFFGW
jgi:hypothetical protein